MTTATGALAARPARPAEGPAPRPDVWARLFGFAAFALPVCLAVVYSGAERYFYAIARPLQFGFDGVVAACVVVSLVSWRRARLTTLAVVPYLAWIVCFHLWGLLVSPTPQRILSTAVSAALLNVLVLTATAVALGVPGGLSRLAGFLQVAVLVNAGLAIWEATHPLVVIQLADVVHSDYYNRLRPAGLWIQPNVAAIGFLFALILSRFATWPGPAWIWLARVAAVVGIFLSGSRSGLYPLLLCLAVLGIVELRASRLGAAGAVALLLVAAGLAGLALTSLLASESAGGLASSYEAARFLDFRQELRTPSDPSRTTVAGIWLEHAVSGPWQGSGLYTYRGVSRAVQGAHDAFIAVWGETGLVGLVTYVGVLAAGIAAFVRSGLRSRAATTVACLWLIYLVEALVDHNQFTSVTHIIVIGSLLGLPAALAGAPPAMSPVTPTVAPPGQVGRR